MTGIRSNSSIFERRGDAWISEKDQDGTLLHRRADMTAHEVRLARITGKPALTEIISHRSDPDMDRWTKAGFREERVELPSDAPIKPKPDAPTQHRRLANIGRSLRKKTNARTVAVKSSKSALAMTAEANRRHEAEAENRIKRTVSGYSIFIRHSDGREEERDRATKPQADLLFARMRKDRSVVAVEIWSYTTGEMLARYERRALPPEGRAK